MEPQNVGMFVLIVSAFSLLVGALGGWAIWQEWRRGRNGA